MSHRHIYLLEKFQVQLATLAAAAAAYLAAWPAVRPSDPAGPVTFLASGNVAGAGAMAGILLMLAAACALVTLLARPEGALLAALVGAGGISLRSPSLRALLWRTEDRLTGTFGQLMLEVLLLASLLLAVALVIDVIRWIIASLRPNWLWRSPLGGTEGRARQAAKPGAEVRPSPGPAGAFLVLGHLLPALAPSAAKAGRKSASRPAVLNGVKAFLACQAISVVLVMLLMRSGDRGQVLFALLASFLLAALIADQAFPSNFSWVLWITPTIAALALYALAAAASGNGERAWMLVPYYGYALPIDWLTAGTGGAVLGYWISARSRDAHHLEEHPTS